ncbi:MULTISPECIES: bactofilin family protein [Grimontia]|uniref:Polymer-forming cytoskeletal n=1 Tax=Grimontia marina TaxID=646534 RepID=A0A128FD69_9GAMM|nr:MULTISPECIES: polymer-forming cytoskeletal protein [Grimontia]WRW00005.1 polymer-forming cytoskeletal protein [Grimontia sp. NTOU-MAR1]CZF84231.1 Polymer-forming cytoskeletal [Grimontia marina]
MGMFGKKTASNPCLSLIAKECRVIGEFDLEGDIQFDGQGEGTIIHARNVVISSTGHFKGDIRAEHVTINGYVEGTCIAHEVNILSSGKMKGQIQSEQLTIAKGGCLMGENKLKDEPSLKVVNEEKSVSDEVASKPKKTSASA